MTTNLASLKKQLDEKIALREQLRASSASDFKKEAEEVLSQLWKTFPTLKNYLDQAANQVKRVGFVNSRAGRKRNMFRVLTEKPSYLASAERSAKNAPIQGIASEIGLKAAYLILKEFDKTRRVLQLSTKRFPRYTRQVHDANYAEVPYEHVIVFVWIYQYIATSVTTATKLAISWTWLVRFGRLNAI